MDIIARKTALAQGMRTYYTGVPCKRGHDSDRSVKRGNCMQCQRERGAQYRADNPHVMENWRRANPTYASDKYHEQRDGRREQNRQWYLDNRDRALAAKKAWYYSRQDLVKAHRKKWYADNPDYDRRYYYANRDRFRTIWRPAQRKRYDAKIRQRIQERFQELAVNHVLPARPTERDFKYWLAGEIIKRTGQVVLKEIWLDVERTSRIDLLLPESKIALELKLSNLHCSTDRLASQVDRYASFLVEDGYDVVGVSLDGSIGISAEEFLDQL